LNNKACLLSIDIGTTRSKAILYNEGKGIVGQDEESYSTHFPQPGFVEQDPDEVLAGVIKLIRNIIGNVPVQPKDIAAACFGGVWQSFIPVDIEGNALHPAIMWTDTRSTEQNESLRSRLNPDYVRKQTGCGLHPIYFPSRLLWLKEKIPDLYKRTFKFISIKEYIINHLFGGYQVDHSIASGTGIWNMYTKNWDSQLLSALNVKSEHLSECIEPTSFIPGGIKRKYSSLLGLMEGTPGIIGASDGALSHLGSAGVNIDRLSMTIGTGAALRRCISSPYIINNSEAYCYYLAEDKWLSGGVLLNAGNVFRWFADNVMFSAGELNETFKSMDQLAVEIPTGSDGLFFIPLLSGERCPNYRPEARGVIYGLTLSHSRGHLVRSLMEGLAYSVYSVYKMLSPDSRQEIVASGGVLNSPVWLKIISDFLGKTIWLPVIQEAASLGGVILGLKATNIISSLEDSLKFIDLKGKQEPDLEIHKIYNNIISEYDFLNREINKYEDRK
jgi:gluconokinase